MRFNTSPTGSFMSARVLRELASAAICETGVNSAMSTHRNYTGYNPFFDVKAKVVKQSMSGYSDN